MIGRKGWFFSVQDGRIDCGLCPRHCSLAPDSGGICRVRFNRGGSPDIPFYGFITSLAEDPIEKKPLYHFRPGSYILSAGFAGCNLRCPFCQNWHISQRTDVPGRRLSPEELIAAVTAARGFPGVGPAVSSAAKSIAYTYSEPLVHIEFLLDAMEAARDSGVANVLVSNGCVSAGAAEEILELTDAANIDLKCFSAETYKKVLGGDLETVLAFIRLAVKKGVHLELTTLVVPGLNDSREELERCFDFAAGLLSGHQGKGAVPYHLSAYHPDWKWNAPPTSAAELAAIAAGARQKLAFVYTGNVAGEKNDTLCGECGAVLVSRRGYHVDTRGLAIHGSPSRRFYSCASCGSPAPIAY
ncbi:MAG: AmmeMemoRadiSam system radical SAM enzyme [Treponema sp.]|jgi:pyruvate formate lyase activating enzyme|nr:AmmeMemoRadiSam system radical SAM enzyme [Treponema sp.]